MNGLQLITSSMRLIGALANGEQPSASEAQDSLSVLNMMIDSWDADRLTCYAILIQEFPLVSGQQTYTMGPGGNFNTARPAKIDHVSIVSLTNTNQPLELDIDVYTDEDWAAIPVKNILTSLPQGVYDDKANPLRNLSFWPIPNVISNTIIYSWGALTAFPDLVTQLTFPPGYQEALRYNLAMRLIAEFPGEYNPLMAQVTGELAVSSLARIKSINLPLIESHIDPALTTRGGRYNYFSDLPVGGRQ